MTPPREFDDQFDRLIAALRDLTAQVQKWRTASSREAPPPANPVFLFTTEMVDTWRHSERCGEHGALTCACGLAALQWKVHPLRGKVFTLRAELFR